MWFEIEVIQGQDYEAIFSALDPVTSVPIDIRTGHTLDGSVAALPGKDEPTIYTFPIGETGLLAQNGSLIVRIPAAVSRNWDFERVYFGIEVVKDDTSEKIMGIWGPLRVKFTVT